MPEDAEGVISLTSDDDDDVVLRPQARSVAPERRDSQPARPKRRLAVNLLPEAARRRTSRRLQDTVVDLTSLPDDEVVPVGSSSAGKKRRKAPVVLPDSPVSEGKAASKCGICFLDMSDSMFCGPCGHVFCETCLKQAVKNQKKCPSCRRTLQARQIHRIYLPNS